MRAVGERVAYVVSGANPTEQGLKQSNGRDSRQTDRRVSGANPTEQGLKQENDEAAPVSKRGLRS